MLKKINAAILRPIHVIIFIVMVAMVLLATSQIFFRYVLSIAVPWTEELARVFFVWMIFVGTLLVEEDGSQVRTMLLVERLPKLPQAIWEGVITLSSIVFQIIMFVGSLTSWDAVSNITLGSLTWISYRILYIPVIVGAPICIWYMAVNFYFRIKALYAGEGGA